MAIITKIEVQKNHKDRVNVFLDGEYSLSLYLETALKYRLGNGSDIDEDQLRAIRVESDEKIATDKAVKYMARALKSVKDMRTYLQGKGYDGFVVDKVIAKLKEYNYLNDEYYAKQYYLNYKNKYGTKKIMFDLSHKGISDSIVAKVIEENENHDESEQIIRKLAEKYMKNKELTLENGQKLYRFLVSKGFEYEDVGRVVKEYRD